MSKAFGVLVKKVTSDRAMSSAPRQRGRKAA
jgi:hypothetical protein